MKECTISPKSFFSVLPRGYTTNKKNVIPSKEGIQY